MYQRKSKLQNLIILLLDCICIIASLTLANYIRNGRLFDSDNARMDFGMLLGACLMVYLAMNLLRYTNYNMFLRGPFHEIFSYEITGIALVDQNKQNEYEGIRIVSDLKGLVDYCKGASLDEVIIAVDNARKEQVLSDLEILSEMGITIHYQMLVPDLRGASQKVLSQFGHFYTVTYANKVAPVGQVVLKRILDILGALVGCLILFILTLVMGPLIKLESSGPIFFAQKRVGRNGRIFKMYKFRSMYADAEERKRELMAQNEMSGLMFKMENDPRITKFGRFMRKTSLDEFPQFVNILKGDMSLVGTRPPTLDEFAQYSPYHKKRLSFKPGLTGMWQVSGRSDITDFEEIVKLDVEYIDNWSFILDIKILLKTVLQVFTAKGAK